MNLKSKLNVTTGKERVTIQSVERALNILELLTNTQEPLGVIEISKTLHINRTTVYGLLNALIKKEFVFKSNISSKYTISCKMYNLSYSYPNRHPVAQYASPYMIKLANRYNVTVHLGVYSILKNILLLKAQFPSNIQNIHSGSLFPLHATGMGKVFMAFLPPDIMEKTLETLELKPFTSNTIVDKGQLLEELKCIQAQGYSRDRGEYLENTFCIAFPIFNANNKIVAAISLSSSQDVIDPQLATIIPDGLQSSKSCSMEMGWIPFSKKNELISAEAKTQMEIF